MNQEDKKKSCAAFSYRLTRHWNQWLTEFEKAIAADPEEDVYDLINEAKGDELETLKDVRRALGKAEAPKPPELKTRPKVMIIANQNVNGDDLASRLSEAHQQAVGFKPLIILATNVDVERDALIHSFRSPRDDNVCDVPGMANFLQPGIDNETIADFADYNGEFNKRKFGGIYKLEILMRAMLRAGHRPALYNDDQLAAVKEEATRENVLDDQQQTLVTLWQGIKARVTASMADREQLLAWDIENRISIFMLAAAEESGGTLPENFDQWAEDAGDQTASPRGEKRKRKDTYGAVSKTLMSENQGLSGVSDLARIFSNVTKH